MIIPSSSWLLLTYMSLWLHNVMCPNRQNFFINLPTLKLLQWEWHPYIEVCPPLELLLSFLRLTNEIQTSWWFLLCFRNKKKKNIVMHYAKIDNMFLIITPKRTLFCYTSIKYMLHHMLWPLFSILPYFFSFLSF